MNKLRTIGATLSSPAALLLFATALAAGVAGLAYLYLQQREDSMKREIAASARGRETPRVAVVVPKTDVGPDTVLNTTVFVSRKVDADLVYPDTLLARDFASMEGLRLARPVLGGRPVRMSDLQQPEVDDVAAIVPAGMRAVTIAIDNLNSIAQTLRPLHRVDLFLLSNAPAAPGAGSERPREQASLFMQNMLVLATGREFRDAQARGAGSAGMARPGAVDGARDKGFDSITLLVKPQEAARLLIGQKMGAYRVALRGARDGDLLAMKPLLSSDLAPDGRTHDAGIEFIAGGRGPGGQVVSRLPLPELAPAPAATSTPPASN
ncbi:Flp pilus assembly protein CpaB [Massilia forsythiae]|uniref:Flp pilus assembly protein CpaB n=1 Tax=Massilia forsythiae TaxID=2728020 RepID=A0A7Z2VZU3_9BURK|nr:Flp pilus assembly protein CpaB [Massilia forsythiae]QJE02316.1 Flp pilus assembly protein CpaB [Massilia forsythiae]